jgi:DNA-binding NtrC family response regulator
MVADARNAAARQRARDDETTSSVATVKRLLLVDDDLALLRAVVRVLGQHFTVETATNAEQAAELLERRRYDLVVSDFDMPGRNGIWLLELARRRLPESRRVLVSGSSPPGVDVGQVGGVIHRFLEKPFSPQTLIAALTE